MLEAIEGFAKRHTLAIGIVATVLVGYYFYARGSANSSTTVTANPNDPNAAEVQAASQYQIAAVQGQTAALQANDALQASSNQINGQVTVAQLQGQNAVSIATLQAQTQQNADTLSANTTQVVSGLQAQVADTQSNNALAATIAAIQGEVDIASLPYTSVTPALIAQVNNLTAQQTGIVGAINAVSTNINNLSNALNYNESTGNYGGLPATNGNNGFDIYSIGGMLPLTSNPNQTQANLGTNVNYGSTSITSTTTVPASH